MFLLKLVATLHPPTAVRFRSPEFPLSPHGFDDEKDILGITVNRWPHGYSYSYNPLSDSEEWAYSTTNTRPCVVGRQRYGRIAIANCDASASPHTDGSINEAYRAVNELLESS